MSSVLSQEKVLAAMRKRLEAKKKKRGLSKNHPLKNAPTGKEVMDAPVSYNAFDESFQEDFLRALAQNRLFANRMVGRLDPFIHFENPVFQWIADTTMAYWQRYTVTPDVRTFTLLLNTQIDRRKIASDLGAGIGMFIKHKLFQPLANEEFVIERSNQWVTMQIQAKCIEELQHALRDGNLELVQSLFEKGAYVAEGQGEPIESYVYDTEMAIERRENIGREGIPIGLPVDKYIQNTAEYPNEPNGTGVPRGNFYAILAGTGVGKTSTAVNAGATAVENGYKVFHVSLETTLEDLRDMYDSRWMRVNRSAIYKYPDLCRETVQEIAGTYGDSLRYVRHLPGELTLQKLESQLHVLKADGFVPDVIIIDSPADMIPYVGYNGGFYEKADVVGLGLMKIAVKTNTALWGTFQGNRASLGAKIVSLDMIGDSIKSVQRAAAVVCLCQTKEQSKETDILPIRMGTLLAKQRWGRKNILDYVACDHGKISFDEIPKGTYEYDLIQAELTIDDSGGGGYYGNGVRR